MNSKKAKAIRREARLLTGDDDREIYQMANGSLKRYRNGIGGGTIKHDPRTAKGCAKELKRMVKRGKLNEIP